MGCNDYAYLSGVYSGDQPRPLIDSMVDKIRIGFNRSRIQLICRQSGPVDNCGAKRPLSSFEYGAAIPASASFPVSRSIELLSRMIAASFGSPAQRTIHRTEKSRSRRFALAYASRETHVSIMRDRSEWGRNYLARSFA